MKLERRNVRRGRVEIIPMIDAILLLLVFYMSFSTISSREKQLDAALPAPVHGGTPEFDILVHVRSETDFLVNGASFDLTGLRTSLAGLKGASVPARVIIDAEGSTPYQAIIKVMDACAQAGLRRVGFRPISS